MAERKSVKENALKTGCFFSPHSFSLVVVWQVQVSLFFWRCPTALSKRKITISDNKNLHSLRDPKIPAAVSSRDRKYLSGSNEGYS